MNDSHEQMRAYYAARAPYYDAVYDKPERAQDIAFLREYLPAQLAQLDVLEVACGTGYWTQHIAPVAKRYLVTDATAEPLEFAKLRPGTQRSEFALADAYALPESFGQFQAAFAGLWFSHVPITRQAEFLTGLHARLLPNARVILMDNSEVQCIEHPLVETDADGNTYQHRPLRDGSIHRVLKIFPSEAQLRALLPSGAHEVNYRMLDNFWLFEYRLAAN